MKSILFVAGFLISQVGFSFGSGSFKGDGTWKEPQGGKGTWSEETSIKEVEGGFEITSSLKVLQGETVIHEENGTIKIVVKEHGFFDVVKNDAVVGNGYCFHKVCHYDYAENGETGEETIHFGKKEFHKIGSSKGEQEGHKWSVAWRGTLKKAK